MNIVILFPKDPTTGRILTEVTFLNSLLETLSPTSVTVLATHKILTKFIHLAKLINCDNVVTFDGTFPEADLVFTWTSSDSTNFFGGLIPNRKLNNFLILSHYTNNGTLVLARHCDSKYEFKDFKSFCITRFTLQPSFCEINSKTKDVIENTPGIDYSNMRLLLNGSKEDGDWSSTNTVKVEPMFLGDDIFFDVSTQFEIVSKLPSIERDNRLVWFGFLSDLHKKRVKVLKSLSKVNDICMYADEEPPGLSVNTGYWVTGTEEFHNIFRRHRAFVYIGKGDGKFAYRGKTVYDSIVAGTPVLVLESADPDHRCFPGMDCYFKDAKDLKALNERVNMDDLIAEQTKFIKGRLKSEKNNIATLLLQ